MKHEHKKWSRMILLGSADFDSGNFEKAAQQYKRAQLLAEHLIADTIMTFDGDIKPLTMYNYTCCCLVRLHIQTGDSAAARACLDQTSRKFMSILNNSAYPLLIRGKVIREFEPLMNLAIQSYQSEGRPDEAYAAIGDWLYQVKHYVSRMRPVQETVLMN